MLFTISTILSVHVIKLKCLLVTFFCVEEQDCYVFEVMYRFATEYQ